MNVVWQTTALHVLFSLLRHLSESFSKTSYQPQLHVSHFRKIVNGLLLVDTNDGKVDPDVRDQLVATWFTIYHDIRWFLLRESAYVS